MPVVLLHGDTGTDQTSAGFGKQTPADPTRRIVVTGWIAMLVFAFSAFRNLSDVGDTWIAMASGRHIAHHGVNSGDPFSFNSLPRGPTRDEIKVWPRWIQRIVEKTGVAGAQYWHPTGWINQNWLSHLMFYRLAAYFGTEENPNYTVLLFLKFLFYLTTVLTVYSIARMLGAHPALSSWCACLSMLVGMGFTGLRPNEFSNLLAPVFILLLVLATYRNVRYAWLIVPMGILWSNLHGGYMYILIMLIPFIVLHALIVLPRRWTIWCYSALAWLIFYVLAWRNGYEGTLLPEAVAGPTTLALAVSALVFGGFLVSFFAGLKTACRYHVIASSLLFLTVLAKRLAAVDLAAVALVVLFLAFVALGAVITYRKSALVPLKPAAICHLVAVYAVTAILMVVFSPFHITNVTHIWTISCSQDAQLWRRINEWRPVYDWNCKCGDVTPFIVMVGGIFCVFISWAIVQYVSARRRKKTDLCGSEQRPLGYRLDVVLLTVVVLTLYMAIRSRRFIAIAAFVSCPFLAMWIGQTITALSQGRAARNQGKRDRGVSAKSLLCDLTVWATIFAVCFGLMNGYLFVEQLVVPWPYDFQNYSAFERIVSVHRQPRGACEFLKQNKVKGRMLNDWIEGGYIAWSMDPQAKAGEIELKLFIDGRAQTAYSAQAYRDWLRIWRCHSIMRELGCKRDTLSDDDRNKIGQYVADQLKEREVTVVLANYREPFNHALVESLTTCAAWQVVYLDEMHKLFVSTSSPDGQRLMSGIENDKIVYPDEYTKHINLAHFHLKNDVSSEAERVGLEHAIRAFQIRPSIFAARMITTWRTESDELSSMKKAICQDYVDEYEARKTELRRQAGFAQRSEAAKEMAAFLN
jgi:hypothetical protein